MANTREIQSRMKSIQDTMKITNAMYMISSTKLRKAKKNLEETEPYFYTLQTMVSRIVRHLPEIDNKYFDERKDKPAEEKTTGLVVVTADKGLAGAYNHNVLKMAEEQMRKAGRPESTNCSLSVNWDVSISDTAESRWRSSSITPRRIRRCIVPVSLRRRFWSSYERRTAG